MRAGIANRSSRNRLQIRRLKRCVLVRWLMPHVGLKNNGVTAGLLCEYLRLTYTRRATNPVKDSDRFIAGTQDRMWRITTLELRIERAKIHFMRIAVNGTLVCLTGFPSGVRCCGTKGRF